MYPTDVDLYTAARNGASEQVERYLAQGANVNCASAEGNNTPLHLAALKGHLKVVQVLLDRRASIDAVNNNNSTPLHAAALKGHLQVVQVLLDQGASVDAVNNKNCTPLQLATQNGHDQVAALLARSIALVQVHERAVELLLSRRSASLTPSSIDRSWCTRNRSTCVRTTPIAGGKWFANMLA